MDTVRARIMSIQNNLKGELSALIEREGTLSQEELHLAFDKITTSAVWESLYTLANAIDLLS